MKLGLFLSAQFDPADDLNSKLGELKDQVVAAEKFGFSSVVLGHHYLARSAFMQPIPLAGYLASFTTDIQIVFGVLLAPLLNPLALAEDIATLDALSNGRVTIGLGAGYRAIEFDAFGLPYEERFKILESYVPILRSLLRGEEVTATGHFGTLNKARICTKSHNPDGPPIWLGAFGDIGIKRAARLDTSWLAGPEGDVEVLSQRLSLFRDELKKHGLSTNREYPITRECSVAKTREEALLNARPYLQSQYEGYRNWEQAQTLDFDEFLMTHCLVGTPEDILKRLQIYKDDLGVSEVFLRAQWMGMPNEKVMETIQILGEHVLPEIRSW